MSKNWRHYNKKIKKTDSSQTNSLFKFWSPSKLGDEGSTATESSCQVEVCPQQVSDSVPKSIDNEYDVDGTSSMQCHGSSSTSEQDDSSDQSMPTPKPSSPPNKKSKSSPHDGRLFHEAKYQDRFQWLYFSHHQKGYMCLAQTQESESQLKGKECQKTPAKMDTVRITRSSPKSSASTPSSLYDFTSESPLINNNKNSGRKQNQSKANGKNTKKKVDKRAKVANVKLSSDNKSKSKVEIKITSESSLKSTVTPKGRVSKVIIPQESKYDEKETKQSNKRLGALKPIPPPNLDDISPIVRKEKSATPSRKRASGSRAEKNEAVEKKKLRSSRGGEGNFTASDSYLEENDSANDSAIFVSPRQTMPRFGTSKTSTPANISSKNKKNPVKKMSKLTAKDTSTPNESKPKRGFTGIKENISKLSPVQRLDTPTSDYGSMEIIPTPSPTPPVKASRKKRGTSPAFTLEDDDSGENLNLNKSVDRSYKRSKKKYDTGRFSSSKLDEWADKVNSELEDVENFELSVEG